MSQRYTFEDIYAAANALMPFMRAGQIVGANPEDLDEMAHAVLEAYFGDLCFESYPSYVFRYDEAATDIEGVVMWEKHERPRLQAEGWRAKLRYVIRRLYSRFLSSSLS